MMLFSVYTADTVALGATLTYAEKKIEEIQKTSGFVPGKTSKVVGNCYAFVSAVCEELFGTVYQEELYNGYRCRHRTGKFYEVALLETTKDTNTTNINNIINFFIKNAMPGDVVHYGSLSNSSSTHTFMIQSIDSTKMRIFHSNYATRQYGSETCHIDTIYWDSFRKNPTSSVYNSNGTLYSHNSLFYNKMRYSGMGVTINRYTKYTSLYYPTGVSSSIPPTVSATRSSPYSIKLAWNYVTGASKYEVQYKLSSASSYSTASSACTTTSFDVKKLKIGSTYNFRVRAYAGGKWHGYSSVVSMQVLPPTVGSATVKPADKGMYLSWPKKTDITGVKIYKKTSSQSSYSLLKTLGGTAYDYTDTAVKYGETYNYKIIRYVTSGSNTYNSPDAVYTKKYELKTPTIVYNRRSTTSVEIICETDGCQTDIVYYLQHNGQTIAKNLSTKKTTFVIDKLTLGNEYTVYCAERTSIGQGSYGKLTFKVLPKDMENIRANMDVNGVKVTFETQGDIDGYKVYRSNYSNKNFTQVATLGKTATYYLDKKVKYNSTYYYQVKSYKTAGSTTYYSYCFNPSNALKYHFYAPKVTVKRATPSSVKVTAGALKGAEKYTLQYKVKGGKWITVNNLKTVNDYQIKKLKVGKKYYFRVRAQNRFGIGDYNKEVAKKVLPPKPEKPTAKALKKGIQIAYKPQTYATGYMIYRSTKSGSGYKLIKTIKGNTTSTFNDKKAVKGKTYYYKIVCYKTYKSKQYQSPKSAYVAQKY